MLAPLSWQYTLLEGERAAQSIVDGINALDANPEVDVIVIIRGGGRTENLAPFDELDVLRAIIGCSKYLVTGIGHHEDHVLADDVADYVVATPTAAAIHVAKLCVSVESPIKAAKSPSYIPVNSSGIKADSPTVATHEPPAPKRQRRYDLLVFILLIVAVGAIALLAYAMIQYL